MIKWMNQEIGKVMYMGQEITSLLFESQELLNSLFILGSFELFDPPLASNNYVTDVTGKILNISTTTFLQTFYDGFIGTQPDGMIITKTSLGLDHSGQYHIYEYDFKPSSYDKTILLSSGMHTYELSATFGLAHFISNMMNTPYLHEGFEYLRKNVRIKVIPIINPWGFNQSPKKYGNINGVNINRNFDYNGNWEAYPSLPEDEWNWKGTAPYSEIETQILRDWVIANSGSEFWIDCHTGLNLGPCDNFIYYLSDTPLRPQIELALSRLEERITTKYGKATPTKNVVIDSEGSIRHRFSQYTVGVPTMTLEQTPNNLLWGTSLNNESGDITEFAATLCAYTFTFLTSLPFLTSSISTLNITNEDIPSIDFKINDNDSSDVFTANYVLNGITTTVGNLTKGTNTWVGTTLTDGAYVLTITVTDKYNLTSNTLIFSINVSTASNIVVSDTFTRANSSILGTTEIGGKVWTNVGASSYSISSNKAKSNSLDTTNHTYIDAGISDFEVSADIMWNSYAGFHFRYANDTNRMLVRINSTSLGLFSNRNSATATTLGTYTFTPTQGNTYKLKVVCNGSAISVYLNDILQITATESNNSTNTKIGFRTSADNISTFDNFEVKSI